MLWRNEDLWREGLSIPSPGSPLRSYEFWHRYFCLDYRHPDLEVPRTLPVGWIEEGWSARFTIARFDDPMELGILKFEDRGGASSLDLAWYCSEPYQSTTSNLAHWDRAHHFPYLFRWSEMLALVRVLEGGERPMTPSSPSLATLLLAPFTAIVDSDEVDQCQDVIATEIAGLGLFDPEETRLASTLSTMGPDASWERDPSVGWRLDWDQEHWRKTKPRTPVPYSLRAGGSDSSDFPAPKFLRLLAAAGVEDLGEPTSLDF